MMLGWRAISVAASLLQIVLYGRILSANEFFETTTALVLTSLLVSVTDLGVGLAISVAVSSGNRLLAIKMAIVRVLTGFTAFSLAITLADSSLRPFVVALAGFTGSHIVRSVAFAFARAQKPVRYEFRALTWLNIFDSATAIIVLLITESGLSSLRWYSAAAVISTSVVVRLINSGSSAKVEGSERSGFDWTALAGGLPAFISGLHVRLLAMAIASSDAFALSTRAHAEVVASTRVAESAFATAVGYIVLPRFAGSLGAPGRQAPRRAVVVTMAGLALLPLGIRPIFGTNMSGGASATGHYAGVGLAVAAAFVLSLLVHEATASKRSLSITAIGLFPAPVIALSIGLNTMWVVFGAVLAMGLSAGALRYRLREI